jgi:hypothetical protein
MIIGSRACHLLPFNDKLFKKLYLSIKKFRILSKLQTRSRNGLPEKWPELSAPATNFIQNILANLE